MLTELTLNQQHQVDATIATLTQHGVPPSRNKVIAAVGGRRQAVLTYLARHPAYGGAAERPQASAVSATDQAPPQEAAPTPPVMPPPREPTTELAALRQRYWAAQVAVPTMASLHDPVRVEQATVLYEHHHRVKFVRKSLRHARQLHLVHQRAQGRRPEIDESGERLRVLKAALAVVAAFVGAKEAHRLLGNAEEPHWSLQGE